MRLNSMYELSNEQRLKFTIVLMEYLNAGDWKTLFIETDCEEFAQQHTQFYEDVSWENETLEQDCIDAVEFIFNKDSANLRAIWEVPGVKTITSRQDEALHNEIEALIEGGDAVDDVIDSAENNLTGNVVNDLDMSLNISNLNVNPVVFDVAKNLYKALDEADLLLNTESGTNAFDLMYAALDSYLQQTCTSKGIPFDTSDEITVLMAKVNVYIKGKADSPLNVKTLSLLRTANSLLTTINDLKNYDSSSEFNDYELTDVDAKFAINLSRLLITYVDELI